MSHAPYFSIIIPFYNSERHISRSLASVINQDYKDFEIILINDGSEDDTEKKAKEILKKDGLTFTIVSHGENKGIGAARNSGIKIARGKYISFLDSDDLWYKNKLLRIKQLIEEDSCRDLLCHDLYWVENGKKKKKLISQSYCTYEDLLFQGNSLFTSGVTVKKEALLMCGGFSEELRFNGVEDYDLWMRLSRICTFFYVHELLGEYHFHGEGITAKVAKHNENHYGLLEYHLNFFQDSRYDKQKRKRRAEVLQIGGRYFIKIKDFPSARKKLYDSFSLNPTFKTFIYLLATYFRIPF